MSGCPLPEDFQIGVGSSAYQIEGAPFKDGKGENCIDRYCRTNPDWNTDHSNGDIACDSYNRTTQDLELLQELGVDFYRFSISWCRIAPNGDVKSQVNEAGFIHYRNFILRLLQRNIKPMVTLYHWDLPQQLQDLGGWANRIVIEFFVDYAELLFSRLGDLVKDWYTLNEPQLVGEFMYGGGPPPAGPPYPPGVVAPGLGDYLALHHQLLAHAAVYRLYQTRFQSAQAGRVGIVCQVFWAKPKTDSEENKKAAQRSLLFELDAVLHPLVVGDYPPQLRAIIDEKSSAEGRSVSRLPIFTKDEINLVKGSFDFLGLNHYSTFLVSAGCHGGNPSQARDSGVIKQVNPLSKVPGVAWLAHEPEGIRSALNYIREKYGRIPVYISENGCDDPSGIHDVHRIQYLKDYMRNVVLAVQDGCHVLGYTIWSFLDSYEWADGYKLKFGLYQVDFNSPERKRTPKDSVHILKEIIKKRAIPN